MTTLTREPAITADERATMEELRINPADIYMMRLQRHLAPGVYIEYVIREAREWVIECGLASDDISAVVELVENLSDAVVVMWVARNYDGGLASFARSIQ